MSVFANTTSQPESKIDENGVYIKDLVIRDMIERAEFGRVKYGTYLQPENGRDPLIDLYQELIDGAMYVRQELYKRYGK